MIEHNAQNTSASEAPTATYESFIDALNGLHDENKLRDALREFVKRGAATARNRTADLHVRATKTTGAIENALVELVNGVAEANREVANAALQEVETACVAVDKLVGATSFDEARKAYFDYLRHQGEVGAARTRSAAGLVSAKASEAFDAFRDSATKFPPTWFRAA
ncbi:MAG TPA: hypothetical protein VGH40_04740 [Roseiarcus sp.]|jgi:hypothetical protein